MAAVASAIKGGNELEQAAGKALTTKEEAPKRKHICFCLTPFDLVILSWRSNGGAAFFDAVKKTLKGNEMNGVANFKAQQVLHTVIREGPPQLLRDSTYQVSFLQALGNTFQRSPDRVYGPLIAEYSNTIVAKISFHQNHPEFDGCFTHDDFVRKNNNTIPPVEKSMQTIGHMLDLQEVVCKMMRMIFVIRSAKDLQECRVACLVPLVLESYAIYQMTEYFLKRLVDNIYSPVTEDMNVFGFLVQRFYTQYMDLRNLYFESANVKYVASIIAVPTLPKDPPQFQATRKKASAPAPDAAPEPVQLPPAVAPNPFMADNPFATANWDANLGTRSMPGWQRFGEEPAPVPVPEPAPVVVDTRPKEEEFDWRARIRELEEMLARERAEKEMLRKQVEALTAENAQLRNTFQQMMHAHELEKQRLLAGGVDAATEDIEMMLRKLADPNDLGNPNATAADIMASAHALGQALEELEAAIRSGDKNAIMKAVRGVAAALGRLLADIKGASRLTDDPAIKQMLFDAARAVARAVSALLQSVGQNDANGMAQGSAGLRNALRDVGAAAERLATAPEQIEEPVEQEGMRLEDFATNELLAAARTIEEAARSLLRSKESAQRSSMEPEQLQVADAIYDAAYAITNVTGNLIKMATIAQKERVAKGRAANNKEYYKKERTFAEGLISAAKAVAYATVTLVDVANKAVMGEIDEESLIAASKGVASATAQLVAASRVTADPGSMTQQNLEAAAKQVTNAVALLVEAARAAGQIVSQRKRDARVQKAEQLAQNANSEMAKKKAKMEAQALVLTLERELKEAQRLMFMINKGEYEKKV